MASWVPINSALQHYLHLWTSDTSTTRTACPYLSREKEKQLELTYIPSILKTKLSKHIHCSWELYSLQGNITAIQDEHIKNCKRYQNESLTYKFYLKGVETVIWPYYHFLIKLLFPLKKTSCQLQYLIRLPPAWSNEQVLSCTNKK